MSNNPRTCWGWVSLRHMPFASAGLICASIGGSGRRFYNRFNIRMLWERLPQAWRYCKGDADRDFAKDLFSTIYKTPSRRSMVNLNQDATKRFSSKTWRESFQLQTWKPGRQARLFACVTVNNYRTNFDDFREEYLFGNQVDRGLSKEAGH